MIFGFHVLQYTILMLVRDSDSEGKNLGEGQDLEEEFIVIPARIMLGKLTSRISLNLLVLLFMAQSMVAVAKYSS